MLISYYDYRLDVITRDCKNIFQIIPEFNTVVFLGKHYREMSEDGLSKILLKKKNQGFHELSNVDLFETRYDNTIRILILNQLLTGFPNHYLMSFFGEDRDNHEGLIEFERINEMVAPVMIRFFFVNRDIIERIGPSNIIVTKSPGIYVIPEGSLFEMKLLTPGIEFLGSFPKIDLSISSEYLLSDYEMNM